jgi:hypothetical protein
MTSHIDLRTLPLNIPSLCIPRVFPNIDEKRIRRIFDDLALGEIQAIDFVSKKTEKGENFNRIFVHFRRWYSNRNADTARERLLDGKEIKIIYDDPWFWKVSAYRPPAQPAPRPAQKPARPHIEFDSEEERRPRPKEHQERRPRNEEHQSKPKRKESNAHNDEFGRDKALRQEAHKQETHAVKPQPENVSNFVALPRPIMKRRIIQKNYSKAPLKIEDPNLEEGEIAEEV